MFLNSAHKLLHENIQDDVFIIASDKISPTMIVRQYGTKVLVSTVHNYHKMAARTCSLKFIKAQTDLTCLHAYHLTFLKKHIFLNTTEIKKNHPPFPAVTTLLEYIIIHKHLLSQRHKVYNQTHAGFI